MQNKAKAYNQQIRPTSSSSRPSSVANVAESMPIVLVYHEKKNQCTKKYLYPTKALGRIEKQTKQTEGEKRDGLPELPGH